MDKYVWIVGVAIVVTIGLAILKKYLTSKYSMKLIEAMASDEEDFTAVVDSKIVKFLFDPFNREYMRLNYYLARGKEKKIKDQANLMEKMRLAKKQSFATYQLLFQYYMSNNKEKQAREYAKKTLDFLDENDIGNNDQAREEIETNVKIFLDFDLSQIDYINKQIEEATSDDVKAFWYFRKAFLQKHNDLMDDAMKSMEQVLALTKEEAQKAIMQQLVDENLESL